ncbi:MAG TPA: glycosyltransferase, partial [Gemmatimonadaceae bacterium]
MTSRLVEAAADLDRDASSGSTADVTVSVIVAVYNERATIEECIWSLLQLDYQPRHLELLVVDNDSTDGTAEVLERFGSEITILREPKRGP